MNMNIGVIKGDGIGPEIVEEAMKVLDQVAKVYGHTISYTQLLMGGASIDEVGVPLTEATLAAAKASDAVLIHRRRRKNIPVVSVRAIQASGGRSFAVEKGSELIRKPKTGSSL